MKVYGVYYGCIYEGGGVFGDLYIDKQQAINECKKLVRKEQKQRTDDFNSGDRTEYDLKHFRQYHWRKDNKYHETYWTDSVDCVQLQEFNVIDQK